MKNLNRPFFALFSWSAFKWNSLYNCIVIATKDVCEISAQSVKGNYLKIQLQDSVTYIHT